MILRDLGASVSAFLLRNALNGRATSWSPFFFCPLVCLGISLRPLNLRCALPVVLTHV